ncbi:MAG: HU family DNA-binding protein [Mycobacteriaceae bacterium]
MNKAQLIDLLAQRLGGDKRLAAASVEGVVDIVVRTVTSGENVTITGFGVFEKRSRAARVARNPRTGETVRVAPTAVPSFRPGVNFKAVVSGDTALPADGPAVKRSSPGRGVVTAPVKKTAAKKTTANKTAKKTTAPAARTTAPTAEKVAAATKSEPAKKDTKKKDSKKAATKKGSAKPKK